MLCAKFGQNWLSGQSQVKDIKILQIDGRKVIKMAHLSFQLRSGELKWMFSSLLGYETIGKESGKCRQFSVIYTYSTGTDLHYSNSQ